MAASASASLLPTAPTLRRRVGRVGPTTIQSSLHPTTPIPVSRRRLLHLLSATPIALTAEAALAKDIPLFGLRRKLEKIEEEAAEIAMEGEKAAEKEMKAVEKEIESAEKAAERQVKAVEKEIESAEENLILGGGPVQAATVAAAEAFGVVVGLSVVNGIIGSEVRRSS